MCLIRNVYLWLQIGIVIKSLTMLEAAPQVQILNGATIVGTVNYTAIQNKPYDSFRGIPYAKPPVGNLRFRPPVPISGDYSGVFIYALEDTPSCVQTRALPTDVIGSEDCLYLNVYRPQVTDQNAPLLPVMVWIPGGAFRTGNASSTLYGPDYFLDEDVMIVTVNYRLGILGFLSTGDDVCPGNFGIKDQLLALQWVQENIESFGGNPQLVTLFGQSAGAVSVSYLSQSPLADSLFSGVIFQSGTSLNTWALARDPGLVARAAATILNVEVSTSEILVEGLRQLDYRTLQSVVTTKEYALIAVNGIMDGFVFGPTIEVDHPGAIIVNKSHEQLKNGLYHRVPYIIGYNSLEALFFGAAIPVLSLYTITYVPISMNIPQTSIVTRAQVDLAIKARYGFPPLNTLNTQFLQFASDDEFVRPTLEATKLYSQQAPVYLYRFSYDGPLGSKNRTIPGVGHADELWYFWKQSVDPTTISAADKQTLQRVVRMWSNFAKTRNPTPIDDPLFQNARWPLAKSAGTGNLAYLDIDNNLSPLVNPDWSNFQFWVNLFNRYGRPPYSTY